jgi:hypothetical protein
MMGHVEERQMAFHQVGPGESTSFWPEVYDPETKIRTEYITRDMPKNPPQMHVIVRRNESHIFGFDVVQRGEQWRNSLAKHTMTSIQFEPEGLTMFEPIEGKYQHVMDPDTGAVMFIKGTPEIDTCAVCYESPNLPELKFYIGLEPKYPERPYVPNDRFNLMIKLLLREFKRCVDARPGSLEENTKFLRYMLSGLSAINRKWPLCGSPFFYSDLDSYKGKDIQFPFSFPSNEENAKL